MDMPLSFLYLLLLLIPSLAVAIADGTASSPPQPTGFSPIASASASPNDGTGVPSAGVGSPDSQQAGNEGPDTGSYSISTGAIVGICIGIGAVVIGIATIWTLWFLSNRRGWHVRNSLSRASRRLTARFDAARPRRRAPHPSPPAAKSLRLQSRSPPRAQPRDVEKATPSPGVRDAPPDAPKQARPTGFVPPPPAAAGGRVESSFDSETPVATSFRDKYMRRPGGA